MGAVSIGTAGWSYDDWRGIVYPADVPSRFDHLQFLAGLLDTVEVNSTFYRIPPARNGASWVRRTADRHDFAFAVKLYKGLTHDRDPDGVASLTRQFRDAVAPISDADKLAAVLIQFPWSFRWSDDNVDWLKRLVDALKPLPLAVEVRHRSWLNDAFVEELTTNGVSFCNIDQPSLHDCLPPTSLATADLAYVRLHGRNAAQWFADNADAAQRYNYLYSGKELGEWAQRIGELAGKAGKVLVYTNNHFCGQAVANALQLKSILLNRRLAVPPDLIRAFPQLSEIAEDTTGAALRGPTRGAGPIRGSRRREKGGTSERTGSLFDRPEDSGPAFR